MANDEATADEMRDRVEAEVDEEVMAEVEAELSGDRLEAEFEEIEARAAENADVSERALARWAVDPEKLYDGVWIDFDGGIRLKVRSSKSIGYQRALIAAMEGIEDPEEMTEREQAEVIAKAVANGLVTDWEGLVDAPFTKERAEKEFTGRFVMLADAAVDKARDLDNFRPDGLVAVGRSVGNSSDGGDGTEED